MNEAPPLSFDIFSKHLSSDQEETLQLSQMLSKELICGDFISMNGPLGAGKTTFVKGLISALTQTDINEISSPTFSYLNTYDGPIKIHHFDLYRITDEEHLSQLGLYDFLTDKNAICIVEWPEKAKLCQSLTNIKINISYQSAFQRLIEIHKAS